MYIYTYIYIGLPRWGSGKESAWQCRRHRKCGFNPWVRKIPWNRKWQNTYAYFLYITHTHTYKAHCT